MFATVAAIFRPKRKKHTEGIRAKLKEGNLTKSKRGGKCDDDERTVKEGGRDFRATFRKGLVFLERFGHFWVTLVGREEEIFLSFSFPFVNLHTEANPSRKTREGLIYSGD